MKGYLKVLFLICCLGSFLPGCNKESFGLKLFKIIPGGCAAENQVKGSETPDSTGVTYSENNGNLHLRVGFFGGCCKPYSVSCNNRQDSLLITINSEGQDYCNCICFHSYDFIFTGSGAYYKYKVSVNNYQVFSGTINP